jgi:hypothetical protein
MTKQLHLKKNLSKKIKNNVLYNTDIFNKWSNKSKNILFKSNKNSIGNGEEKVAKELIIYTRLGGQNSTVDLNHSVLGNISVKDMTKDNCTLGVEGYENMMKILRLTACLFLLWTEKYHDRCEIARKYHCGINKKYGKSKFTIVKGINRC